MTSRTSPDPMKAAAQSQFEDDRAVGDWNLSGMIGKYAILHTDAIEHIEAMQQDTAPEKVTLSNIEHTARRMMTAVKHYYKQRDALLELGGGKQTATNIPALLVLARHKPIGAYKMRELNERAYADFLMLFHFFPTHLMMSTPVEHFGEGDEPPSAIALRRNAYVLELYEFSAWLHREAAEFMQPLFQKFFPHGDENLPQPGDNNAAIARVAIKIHDAMLETHNNVLNAMAARCSSEQLEDISEDLRDGKNFAALTERFHIATKTLWVTRAILLFFEDSAQGAGERPDPNRHHLSARKVERKAGKQTEQARKVQARNERNRQRNLRRQEKRNARVPVKQDRPSATSTPEPEDDDMPPPLIAPDSDDDE